MTHDSKKKKKIILCGAFFAIILAIALIFVLSRNLSENDAQEIIDDTLEEVFAQYPDDIFKDMITKNTSITVTSLSKKDGNYVADCHFTGVDLYSCISDYLNSVDTEKKADDSTLKELKSDVEKAKPIEQDFSLEFEKTADGYIPIFTDEMVDFCQGNLSKLFVDLVDSQG